MSVKVIFGTAGITALTAEAVAEELQILQKHHIKELDTASIYVGGSHSYEMPRLTPIQIGSEAALGDHGASYGFVIHTKAPGFNPGSLSRSSVLGAMERSLEALKLASVRNMMTCTRLSFMALRSKRTSYILRTRRHPSRRLSKRYKSFMKKANSVKYVLSALITLANNMKFITQLIVFSSASPTFPSLTLSPFISSPQQGVISYPPSTRATTIQSPGAASTVCFRYYGD